MVKAWLSGILLLNVVCIKWGREVEGGVSHRVTI